MGNACAGPESGPPPAPATASKPKWRPASSLPGPSKDVHDERVRRFGADGAVTICECRRFECGVAETRGVRPTMEDCMTIHGNFRGSEDEDFFGVFDGHGGQLVAEYAGMHLSADLQQALADLPPSTTGGGSGAGVSAAKMSAAWTAACGELNRRLRSEVNGHANQRGSTAVCALVHQRELHVANIGDSRAVLCRGPDGVAERLSVDHKPGTPDEKARIEALGGWVTGGGGGPDAGPARLDGRLAVSRAFGDFGFAPKVRMRARCGGRGTGRRAGLLLARCILRLHLSWYPAPCAHTPVPPVAGVGGAAHLQCRPGRCGRRVSYPGLRWGVGCDDRPRSGA
eukprot:SAG22_NODE_275_length_13171_cov_11.640606_8_plen_341_part_00